MPLSIGDKLGPYEILAPLGKGGMGEVYRAHDSRLNRDVAIKVSNAQFTERFTREARAIAALNHTNICHLYDVGPDYLVMEYVEGQDLRGPLDFEDALPIIQQLIDGIEAAHEKNIIHRDLKPANIKITPEGVVKILDFGLAKATEPASSQDGNPENSPTLTVGATQAGAILGTAAYMAPEQAKGKSADRRSDIWAFGVILFELLTGTRLFQGESAVEILGGVLNKEPDISAAPVHMRKLLRWCLEKDRKQRLASISDARRLLNGDGDGADSGAAATPLSPRLGKLGWIAAAIAIAIAVETAWIAWRATRPAPLKPLVRLELNLGDEASLIIPNGTNAILSPDGTRLVYVSQNRLFARKLDQSAATELPDTEGASGPFFSPDGQWVGFFARAKLKKISVDGGAPMDLCDSGGARGGSWGEDGNIVAELGTFRNLQVIPSAGGTPRSLTELGPGSLAHRWPQVLPGARAVLFTNRSTVSFDDASIEVVSIADRKRKTLVRGGTYGRYVPTSEKTGHLIYVSRGTLFGVPFDLEQLEVKGTPIPLLEKVSYSAQDGSAQFDFSGAPSNSGTFVYRSGTAGGGIGPSTVQWLDAKGKTETLLAKPDEYLYPRFSPDGQRLMIGTNDVWIYDWKRDGLTRMTFDGGNSAAVWSPDGRYVVFRNQAQGLLWMRSNGAGKPEVLIPSRNLAAPWSFTPDGKRLAYQENRGGGFDLITVPLENDGDGLRAGKPEPFLQTPFGEREPTFSPDGKWLAYASDESGINQVYVRAFPDKGGKWQVSSNGGVYPVWSRNTHELFFRSEDSRMILVATYTATDDSFIVDKPRVWSDRQLLDSRTSGTNYDVSPDGKRIAALIPVENKDAKQVGNRLIFLENFYDELRRKVPTGK